MKKTLTYIGYTILGFVAVIALGFFMTWAACSGHNRSWGVVGGTSVTCHR